MGVVGIVGLGVKGMVGVGVAGIGLRVCVATRVALGGRARGLCTDL